MVIGDGAHGRAHLRPVDQQLQQRQKNGNRDQDQHLDVGDPDAPDHPGDILDRWVDHHVVGPEYEFQAAKVYQKEGNADGADQRCDLGCVAQRTVRDALDDHSQHGAGHHGQDKRQRPGKLEEGEAEIAHESAHHENVTVGEVDQPDDPVYHSVTEGN